MKTLCMVLLLSSGLLVAQDNAANSKSEKHSKGEVTIQGCVSRASGDYILMKQNPPVSYELQATGKIRLKNYFGERVEVTGTKGPTMASSSDSLNKTGSAAAETITVESIKTIDKVCTQRTAEQ